MSERYRAWKPVEIKKLRRDYARKQTRLIARELGRSESSVYQRALREGLRKSAEYLASHASGRLDGTRGGAHRFTKGHKPWNQGMHWTAGGRSAETRFRKGRRPHGWVPIGSERLTQDGILQRKVMDTRDRSRDWKAVHALVWEQHNGPIPPGHIVIFKDRNRQRIDLENLELITRVQNMRRNYVHRYPKEIARLIQLRGALNRQIRKRERRAQQY